MKKTPSAIKQVNPKPLLWSKTRYAVVMFVVLLVGSLILLLVPQVMDYIIPLIAGVLILIVLFQVWRAKPASRGRVAIIMLPFVAGLVLFMISNQFLFALLGIVPLLAIVFWPVLRSRMQTPAYLQPALKEFQTGTLDQALQLVNQSIQAHPDTWQAYQLRSVIHYSRMQILEAERDARTALKLKQDSFYNHNALGQALLIQGRYAEAKEAFAEALRLAPKQAMNHNLGLACYRLGEYAMAAETLSKRIPTELPPSQKLWLHYLLGRSLEALGQQGRAEQAYRTMERYRDGLERLAGSIRDKPDYPDIVLARADVADIERRLNSKQG